MMTLIREKLGLNWSEWALMNRPEGAICPRCKWPHFHRRWHAITKAVQTRCGNCGLLSESASADIPRGGD